MYTCTTGPSLHIALDKINILKTGSAVFFYYYGNHPKILLTNISDKMANRNSADPDQTAPEGICSSNKCFWNKTDFIKSSPREQQSLT